MKKFEDFKFADLALLRNEIVLNSLYTEDYRNSFGINPSDCSEFFNGYYEYLWELAKEDFNEEGKDTKDLTDAYIVEVYDNTENLSSWYYCIDDFSWVRYYEDDEE